LPLLELVAAVLTEDMLEGFKAVYNTAYSYGTLLTDMGKKFQTPYVEIQTVKVVR